MSGTEIVVILLLALVVLGPEKLPDAIRKFGRTYAELKKMGTGFQEEFKSAIDEPMREMRETADLLKKSVDFSGSSAAPKIPAETTAEPVTDDVTDRPTRNDGVAPADPDLVPTDDVPFADDAAPVEDVAAEDVTADADATIPVEDVTADAAVTVPIEDVAADAAVTIPIEDVAADDVAVKGDDDETADRGEADDA